MILPNVAAGTREALSLSLSGLRKGLSFLGRAWRRQRLSLSLIFGCVCLAVLLHGSGGEDDTYITYWAARVLAEHGRILNYNGMAVEQSSSLSLVVVLAVLYKLLPLSMPAIGYLTSLSGFAMTLALAAGIAKSEGIRRPWLVIPAIGTVTCLAYWATSGMETTLVSACELWMVRAFAELARGADRKRISWALLACGLFVGSRPESPVIAVCVVAGLAAALLLSQRFPSRSRPCSWAGVGRLALVTLAATALLLLFRRLYFHAWVPNPAYMKVGGFDTEQGAFYLWKAFINNGPHLLALFAVALTALVLQILRRGAARPVAVMIVCLAVAHLAFAVASGGDWMSGARFLAPAVPALMLAPFLVGAPRLSGVAPVAALSIANLIFGLQILHHGEEGHSRPLWTALQVPALFRKHIGSNDFSPVELLNKVHLRDAVTLARLFPVMDRLLAAHPERPIWVVSGQAGMLGYHLMARYFGRVKLLDLWSLTTRELYDAFPEGTVSRGLAGSSIGFESALAQLQRVGGPLPEVYYGECLTESMRHVLPASGYVILFEQGGTVHVNRDRRFITSTTQACGHFAVRQDLVESLHLDAMPRYEFDIIPAN